ncbi:hypothetical protein P2A63_15880, partial [Xanthomonas perforans]
MPYAHRAPPPPPPPPLGARNIEALPPCAPDHEVVPAAPADVAHRAAPERQDRGSGDGCLVPRGV